MTTDDRETELSEITIESHRTRASNDGDESVFRISEELFRRLSWVLRARLGKDSITSMLTCLHVEIDNDATTLVCTDGHRLHTWTAPIFSPFTRSANWVVERATKSRVKLRRDDRVVSMDWRRVVPDENETEPVAVPSAGGEPEAEAGRMLAAYTISEYAKTKDIAAVECALPD